MISDCLYLALDTATDTHTAFFPRVCLSVSPPLCLSVCLYLFPFTLHFTRTHSHITLTHKSHSHRLTHSISLLFTPLCCQDPITSPFLLFFSFFHILTRPTTFFLFHTSLSRSLLSQDNTRSNVQTADHLPPLKTIIPRLVIFFLLLFLFSCFF